MKVVVINLDKSTERMEKMKEQFERLDIDYERFSAINGKELVNIREKASVLCSSILCNTGMVGCALSHMEILKKFVESSDEEFICVMEDDVELGDDFSSFLKFLETTDKIEFDMIRLSCVGMCPGKTFEVDGYKFARPVFPLGMACYVVSKNGAKKILKIMGEKVGYHIDFVITSFGNLDSYVLVSPSVVFLRDEITSTMGSTSTSLVLFVLDAMGFKNLTWTLRVPALAFNLKTSISIYQVILFCLLVIGLKLESKLLAFFCVIELYLMTLPKLGATRG